MAGTLHLTLPRATRPVLTAAFAVLLAGLATYVVGAALAPGSAFGDVVYECTLALAAALCLARAVRVPRERRAWSALAGGGTLYLAADLLFTYAGVDGVLSYPSTADAIYVTSYLALCLGVVLLVGERGRWGTRTTKLEAAAGALAAGSLMAEVVFQPGLIELDGSTLAQLTTVAYPSLDVLMIGIVVGAIIAVGRGIGRPFALIAFALVVMAAGDGAYLVQVASDGYRAGGLLDATWLFSVVAIAVAAWTPSGEDVRPAPAGLDLFTTVGCAVVLVGLVAFSTVEPLVPVANLLLIGSVIALLAHHALARRVRRGLALEATKLTEEREQMRRKLHDDSLQYVLAVRQDLRLVAAGDMTALPYAEKALENLTVELRTVMLALTPPARKAEAVEWALLSATAEDARRGGFELEIDVPGEAVGPHADLVFSLGREFIGNAAKHARARRVEVIARDLGSLTEFVVRDDGVGSAPEARARAQLEGHIGLSVAHDRVRAEGGTLEIDSRPGGGTTITATIPRHAGA